MEVIGLIPAAGHAKRIAPLPCSKELYPIEPPLAAGVGPKVVSQFLLEKMSLAGIARAYFVLRPGKWDVPSYFGDGSRVKMRLAYLTLNESPGVPFTIDHAYLFVRNAKVAFGFPDILVHPPDAFVRLREQQERSNADVTLGLCRTTPESRYDLVDFDERGIVRSVILRPPDESLGYTWVLALWTPTFTEFLHAYADRHRSSAREVELSAGHLMKAAVDGGLRVDAVILSEESHLDIGTPEGLVEALRRGARRQL
jgi:glucose-1-phosphate thymidylyltransferase